MRDLIRRPSPAMTVALVALFVALGGSSYAALRIGSKQIANNSVRSKDLRNNDVRSRDIRNGGVSGTDIRNDGVTGTDVNESTLGKVPSAAAADQATRADSAANVDKLKTTGSYKLAQSSASNADLATARAAAAEVLLISFGQFDVYGKCFTDTDDTATDQGTYAEAYIRPKQNGSVFDSDNSFAIGDPDFLNTSTAEDDRELEEAQTAGGGAGSDGLNTVSIDADEDGTFAAAAPDGSSINGHVALVAKNGTPPGGNGLYGAGNACLFWGEVIG